MKMCIRDRLMVGKSVMDVVVYQPHEIGNVVLSVKDLCIDRRVDHVTVSYTHLMV